MSDQPRPGVKVVRHPDGTATLQLDGTLRKISNKLLDCKQQADVH